MAAAEAEGGGDTEYKVTFFNTDETKYSTLTFTKSNPKFTLVKDHPITEGKVGKWEMTNPMTGLYFDPGFGFDLTGQPEAAFTNYDFKWSEFEEHTATFYKTEGDPNPEIQKFIEVDLDFTFPDAPTSEPNYKWHENDTDNWYDPKETIANVPAPIGDPDFFLVDHEFTWEETPSEYTVTFYESDGETEIESKTISESSPTIELPSHEVTEGYVGKWTIHMSGGFTAIEDPGVDFDFSDDLADHIAVWTEKEEYTAQFYKSDGQTVEETKYFSEFDLFLDFPYGPEGESEDYKWYCADIPGEYFEPLDSLNLTTYGYKDYEFVWTNPA